MEGNVSDVMYHFYEIERAEQQLRLLRVLRTSCSALTCLSSNSL